MREIYIHIGLPKCASTFLQNNVFPFMNVKLLSPNWDNRFSRTHNNILIGKHNSKTLISDENLFGDVYGVLDYEDNFIILDRIKRLYPDAKIIAVFRDKKEWVESLEKQFYSNPKRKKQVFNIKSCYTDFGLYKDYIINLFDDSLFLDFNLLKKDADFFVFEIADFIGVDFPVYKNEKVLSRFNDKQISLVKMIPSNGFFDRSFNENFMGLLRRMNK